jgi:antitoxin FitA
LRYAFQLKIAIGNILLELLDHATCSITTFFENKAQEGGEIMPSVTVRNVPDEIHRALRVRAAQHGRSAEAEIREILENAVQPEGRVKLGSLLASIGRKINLSDDDSVENWLE